MSSIPKFDIFSDPDVPIDMACFARQRVFRPEVVQLRSALRAREAAHAAVALAEKSLDEAEKLVRDKVSELDEYMKKTGER